MIKTQRIGYLPADVKTAEVARWAARPVVVVHQVEVDGGIGPATAEQMTIIGAATTQGEAADVRDAADFAINATPAEWTMRLRDGDTATDYPFWALVDPNATPTAP